MPSGDTEQTEVRVQAEVCQRSTGRGKGVGRRLVAPPPNGAGGLRSHTHQSQAGPVNGCTRSWRAWCAIC